MQQKIGRDLPSGVPLEPQDRWIFIFLAAFLCFAPLPLGSNRNWAIGICLVVVFALLVALVWVWRAAYGKALKVLRPYRWPLLLLASMVILTWLQVVPLPASLLEVLSPASLAASGAVESASISVDVFNTQVKASLSVVLFALFLITVLTVRDSERLDRLALVLVWSGVFQAVLGAVLYSIKAEYRIFFVPVSHTRMIGTYVYHNSFAGYLGMTLSIGIGLMLARLGSSEPEGRHWKAKIVSAIAFLLSPKMRLRLLLIILVIALVMTRSRMGNTAVFVSMLVVGLLAIALARRTAPQTIKLIISLVIVDVLVVGTGVGLEKVVERIQETELSVAEGGKSESVEARTEAARTSLPIVRDFPLLGAGGGSFYNIFLSYRTPSYGYTFVDHTHNDYVEIATDYGLMGLGILGTLVAMSLYTTVRVIRKRQSKLPWGIAFGVTMSIVTLLIHSTVDFNLQIPANAMTIVVILAMGWAASVVPPPVKPKKHRIKVKP